VSPLRSAGPGPSDLAKHIDSLRGLDAVIRQRLGTVLTTLGGRVTTRTVDLVDGVSTALAAGPADRMWLTLAVLSGELPQPEDVRRACRRAELDGPLAALGDILPSQDRASSDRPESRWPVEVVTGQVVVDLHHTSGTAFATGIQRVAREVTRRWARAQPFVLVGWTRGYTALHQLPMSAIEGVPLAGDGSGSGNTGTERDAPTGSIIVPWRSTYVLPELLGEAGRVDRFQALAQYSGNRSAVIGFDCVPMTTGETAVEGMGADFAHYLAAVAHTDRVATISAGAAVEFRGWRSMLGGAGLAGPEITPVPLPMDRPPLDDDAVAMARAQLAVVGMPMVLVVGSHEPRKNHRAVLQAAELLWRDGLEFSLLFVGGNSWNSERFTTALHDLQAVGRPVHAVRALTDDLLWAAYAIARCTLFPSLNEGFGLPVAESIASGTPVITSDFGSMREIAEPGGALLVDCHDDHQIAHALRRLLTDDALHATLADQARRRPRRTWDDYADETWSYLVNGGGTGPPEVPRSRTRPEPAPPAPA
jgi:glycosyltransferase involved in cell wall biosynthesis